MIEYVIGDATRPYRTPALITHIVNDLGAWGAGFVLAVSAHWPEPEQSYRAHWQNFALGDVQLVKVDDEITIANVFGQHGLSNHPVRYDAVYQGMVTVAAEATTANTSIHMPRMGAGLAGGSWAVIEAIINETCDGLSVTVYDLP